MTTTDDLVGSVAAWLDHLATQRRLSPNTVAGYRRDTIKLLVWMRAEKIPAFSDLTPDRLRGFLADQHRAGLEPKSLQRLLSSCRSLFHHLARRGELTADPSAGLRAPKARRTLPETLDVDEARALVSLPGDDALTVRDRAMLELFYSSGLRLAELRALAWGDVDLAEGLARVTGKGSKTRIVPVGRYAIAALQELAAQEGHAPTEPLFRGRGGAPLSRRSIELRLKRAALKQGIAKNVYPHLLRHSCASHLLESSGELRAVQELLGHADIGTTEIYTHLDFQHLAEVYDRAHPRAHRKR